jgi:hypothetical protein
MVPGCSNSSNSALVVAPCTTGAIVEDVEDAGPLSPTCALWAYDTYTYFTFTNSASQLLLTDNGSGIAATVSSAGGTPNQAFMFTGGAGSLSTIQPAADPTLCLTVPTA